MYFISEIFLLFTLFTPWRCDMDPEDRDYKILCCGLRQYVGRPSNHTFMVSWGPGNRFIWRDDRNRKTVDSNKKNEKLLKNGPQNLKNWTRENCNEKYFEMKKKSCRKKKVPQKKLSNQEFFLFFSIFLPLSHSLSQKTLPNFWLKETLWKKLKKNKKNQVYQSIFCLIKSVKMYVFCFIDVE